MNGGNQHLGSEQRPAIPKRLTGLTRLWIVISAAWLIGALVYGWNDAVNTKSALAGLNAQMCTLAPQLDLLQSLTSPMNNPKAGASAKNPNSPPTKPFGDCIDEMKARLDTSPLFTVNWGLVLLISLVPIPFFWLAVFGPIRWIAQGFR